MEVVYNWGRGALAKLKASVGIPKMTSRSSG